MSTRLAFVLDCHDPDALAPFWAGALGYEVGPTDDSPYVALTSPHGEPDLLLQRVPEPRSGKNRAHLDLRVDDLDGEVRRLEALGASRVGTPVEEDGWRWQVVADPEGNLLCLLVPAPEDGSVAAGGPTPVADVVRPADRPGDLGWIVQAHGEVYAREHGWSTDFEHLVTGIVGDFARRHDPAREAAWVAEVDGRRVGCIACTARDAETAALRVLLVDPSARGRGLGARLVDTCVRFARDAGYRHMTLWTTRGLDAARHLYEQAGFRLVHEDPPRRMFGHELAGQTWERAL